MKEELFDYCVSTYRVRIDYLVLKCKTSPYKITRKQRKRLHGTTKLVNFLRWNWKTKYSDKNTFQNLQWLMFSLFHLNRREKEVVCCHSHVIQWQNLNKSCIASLQNKTDRISESAVNLIKNNEIKLFETAYFLRIGRYVGHALLFWNLTVLHLRQECSSSIIESTRPFLRGFHKAQFFLELLFFSENGWKSTS